MSVKAIFESMECGLAPEGSEQAQSWLQDRDNTLLHFIGGKWVFPSKEYQGLVRRTTSGDRPVILDPADRAVKFTTILGKRWGAESLPVLRIAAAVVFPRYGIWYLLNIIRIKKDTALYCPSLTLIPVWGWRGQPP